MQNPSTNLQAFRVYNTQERAKIQLGKNVEVQNRSGELGDEIGTRATLKLLQDQFENLKNAKVEAEITVERLTNESVRMQKLHKLLYDKNVDQKREFEKQYFELKKENDMLKEKVVEEKSRRRKHELLEMENKKSLILQHQFEELKKQKVEADISVERLTNETVRMTKQHNILYQKNVDQKVEFGKLYFELKEKNSMLKKAMEKEVEERKKKRKRELSQMKKVNEERDAIKKKYTSLLEKYNKERYGEEEE